MRAGSTSRVSLPPPVTSKMMVNIVENPANWGLANDLIRVYLAGVESPKSSLIVHELDAVIRARGKGGETIAVIAEHETTLDHVMVEHFSDKIANLTREAAEDGGKCKLIPSKPLNLGRLETTGFFSHGIVNSFSCSKVGVGIQKCNEIPNMSDF